MPLYVSWESNQPPPSTVVKAECVRVCPAVRVLWAESTMLLDRSCGDLYTLKYTPDFHASRGTSIFSDLILFIYGLSLLSSVSLAEMFALVNALISLFLYPLFAVISNYGISLFNFPSHYYYFFIEEDSAGDRAQGLMARRRYSPSPPFWFVSDSFCVECLT